MGGKDPRTVESVRIFEMGVQGSTDRRFCPNFKKGCRDPRTAESVQIFKGYCKDTRTVEWVRFLKKEIQGSKDGRISPNFERVMRGFEKGKAMIHGRRNRSKFFQIFIDRGQKSDRAVKWILKT